MVDCAGVPNVGSAGIRRCPLLTVTTARSLPFSPRTSPISSKFGPGAACAVADFGRPASARAKTEVVPVRKLRLVERMRSRATPLPVRASPPFHPPACDVP
jgi:hypothetical protein